MCKRKDGNFYNLRVFKADIPRLYELLSSKADIYSKILLEEIKSQIEKQDEKNAGRGKS
jgi:hypothetical protein